MKESRKRTSNDHKKGSLSGGKGIAKEKGGSAWGDEKAELKFEKKTKLITRDSKERAKGILFSKLEQTEKYLSSIKGDLLSLSLERQKEIEK